MTVFVAPRQSFRHESARIFIRSLIQDSQVHISDWPGSSPLEGSILCLYRPDHGMQRCDARQRQADPRVCHRLSGNSRKRRWLSCSSCAPRPTNWHHGFHFHVPKNVPVIQGIVETGFFTVRRTYWHSQINHWLRCSGRMVRGGGSGV